MSALHRELQQRRSWLQRAVLAWAVPLHAQPNATTTATATSSAFGAALKAFTGGAPLRPGRVSLDIAPLVDNGNTVPVSVRVDSTMTEADRVLALALFTERNPQPEVVTVQFGPHAARAELSTRMRLATTQNVWAVARMADGSCFAQRIEVLVTLAACLEGD
jgi:sulfur-oxidizing protein SoxY